MVLGSSQNSMLRVRGRDAEHIAAWHPSRVLAECRAKRHLVEAAGRAGDDATRDAVLRSLASAYADHPDHLEEWRV